VIESIDTRHQASSIGQSICLKNEKCIYLPKKLLLKPIALIKESIQISVIIISRIAWLVAKNICLPCQFHK